MRLIDADALIADTLKDPVGKMIAEKYNLIGFFEGRPTVEERKTGSWRICTEEIEETFHTGSRCTVCNYWKPMGIWKYCPNCGAKMEE